MNLVAWFFRDYGQSIRPWIRCKSIFCEFWVTSTFFSITITKLTWSPHYRSGENL
jgi:hypothetical protein